MRSQSAWKVQSLERFGQGSRALNTFKNTFYIIALMLQETKQGFPDELNK